MNGALLAINKMAQFRIEFDRYSTMIFNSP